MLAVVSSTGGNSQNPFDGTNFYLDEWMHPTLKGTWLKNDFYLVGNDARDGGMKPFGLVADFRMYARSLHDEEIKAMYRASSVDQHPDRIVRRLADMDAATILAQRLDVPDSAAECLRALGSLATLSAQRAKIYSVCGREVLQLLGSPLPMVKRQASRLLNNIT